jgi:two-component system, sensor histidine kinase LadS
VYLGLGIVFYNLYKILLFVVFVTSSAFSLDISSFETYKTINTNIEILYDKDELYNIKNINLEKFEATDKQALGYVDGSIWSKVEFVSTKEIKNLIFVNPKININIIDVYIFEDDVLIQTHYLGNYRTIYQNYINSKFSNFALDIKENKTYKIISKIKSKSPLDITWIVSSNKFFISYIMYDILFWGVFLGLVFSLIIYNMSVFTSLKDWSYVAYSFHGLMALLFQFATNGIFYQFGFYSNPVVFNSISWILAQFSLISILVFAMLFLNTKKTMPIVHSIIRLLLLLVFVMIVLFVYSFFDVDIINTVRFITKPLSLMIVVFILFVALLGVKKQIQGSMFYLVGHGMFLFALIYQQLGGIINNETNLISIYIVALAVLFDVIFLSLALGQKLSFLKYQKDKNEKLLISQSGFSAIGRTVGNLSHQWKIPIARLGSLLTQMEAVIWKKKDVIKNDFDPIITGMKSSLEFMQSSISEFNSFYSNSSQVGEFNLSVEINHILGLLSAKTMYTDCEIKKDLDESIEIYGHKSAFSNVCLVIIDNALDILKQRKIDKGEITITLSQETNFIKLTIKDNGGGIKITPIKRIFDIFVSDKEDGNGMGLAMVEVLVKERLNGNIFVYNGEDGAVFEIVLNLQ